MALTGSIQVNSEAGINQQPVVPVSLASAWKTLSQAINATSAITPSSATGDTLSGSANLRFNRVAGLGTNVRLRVIYDSTATAVATALQYRLWGRKAPLTGQSGVGLDWQILPNKNGNVTVTAAVAPGSDITIATGYKANDADFLNMTHDCDGCDDFVVEIVAALDHDANDALSQLQVKCI